MGGNVSQEVGGVRVFKVIPGSPAAEAGLEVFFDFIIEVNGFKIEPSCQQVFAEKIQESENAQAKLKVFNTRSHNLREVTVTPRKWAGSGLLGATVRYDMADAAENHGVRVLEVFPNSPAAHAGLVPFQDYVLGTAQAVFHDIDELVEAVTSNINQRMNVYVYNSESETVREVILMPNTDWGGDGCIGCDIGTGLLHRIPVPRRTPGAREQSSSREVSSVSNGAPPTPAAPPPGVSAPSAPGRVHAAGVPAAPPSGASALSASSNLHASGLNLPRPVYPPGMPAIPDASSVSDPSAIPRIGTNGAHGTAHQGAAAGLPSQPCATASWKAPSVPGAMPGAMPGAVPSSNLSIPETHPTSMPHPTQVAGVSWPPPASHEAARTAPYTSGQMAQTSPSIPTSPPASNNALVGSPAVSSPGSSTTASHYLLQLECPRAPPGTPMNLDEVPPPADLSAALDPAKFAGGLHLPKGAVSPLPGTPPLGNSDLYQPGLPTETAAQPPLL